MRPSLVALAVLLASSPALSAERPAPKPYTFAEAIGRAVSRHPSALNAQQEILRAEALVREARAGSFPTLTGNAIGTRLDSDRKIGTNTVQNAQSLSANLQLAVPIFATQRWYAWVHASDQAEVVKVGAQDVKRSLAIAAARAYLAVVVAKRSLEVNERAFRTAEAHFQFAHGRREGGVGNRLDEVRAEQEEASTRAQLELSRSSLARVQEALGIVLAEDGPADAAVEAALPEPPTFEEAVAEAAQRRADVKVLKERSAAASRVVSHSYADYLPTIAGQFQPFYQSPSTATQPQTGWQAQLILNLPLYDGGYRYGARQEREAIEAQTRNNLAGALRQVNADVRAAFEAMTRADLALQAAQRSALLAHEALDLANQAYAAGATTNLEVIDAERRARDADSAAAIAEDSARQARLDLLAASGRFP